jgi:hypothetical protein
MSFITVPYSIAWLVYKLDYKIKLFKIWKEQGLNSDFENLLYEIMTLVEEFIKSNAPGSLHGEWAKKEDCWISLKRQEFDVNLSKIDEYIMDESGEAQVRHQSMDQQIKDQILKDIKGLGSENWKKVYLWSRNSGQMSQFNIDMAHNIGRKIRDGITLSPNEIYSGHIILEEVAQKSSLLQSIFDDNEENEDDD